MKPRERKPQTQSSRLYLRNKDHREVIFNDMYHNAMWANVGDIHDELVWVKYPKKALMFWNYPTFGWMDVDRQFQYAVKIGGGQRGGRLVRQHNGIILLFDSYGGLGTAYILASDDGITWQNITSKFSFYPDMQNTAPLGEDSTAYTFGDDYWHGGGDKAHINWTRVYKDDDGEFQVEQESHVLDCDTSWLDWYRIGQYVGTVNDKFIVVKEVLDYNAHSNQQWFFSIDRSGHVEMLSDPVPQPTWMRYFNDKMTVTQQGIGAGARLFMVTASCMSYDQWSTWTSQITAWTSMDGGRTWNKEVLFGGNTLPDYDNQHGGVQHRIEIFNRDGEIFILFGQACNKEGSGWHEVHLYSTLTGTSWSEIPLPKWVDMPVIHEPSGRGLQPASQETIRVAIRPNETSGQDYNMFDLLESQNNVSNFAHKLMDFQHGNIMWQDGELKELKDTDFYMVIGFNPMLYFDNRYMAESSKAFAWYTTDVDTQMDGADYIQNGDYCVAYNPVPFDPSPYPFWDYYIYVEATQEYVKVARITLPYYSEYYLVVVEYLPQVGANNVLYKVPRYNV